MRVEPDLEIGRTLLGLLLLMPCLTTACERVVPLPEPPDVRPWVIPEVGAELDEAGRFQLAHTRVVSGRPIIAPQKARELAAAFARRFPSYKDLPKNFHGERLSRMDKEHGDIIDFQSLRPGPRVYFVAKPYAPVDDSLPSHVRGRYWPHYLVSFYSRQGLQVLVVTLPAEDRGYWIDEEGRVRPPRGTDFLDFNWTVVSAGVEYPVPLTPECAVRLVGQATDRRIARIPELVHPGGRLAPFIVYWRVELEESVRVQGVESGQEDSTRVLFVGLERRMRSERSSLQPVLYRALPDQPQVVVDTVAVPSWPSPRLGERPDVERRVLQIPLRPDHAVHFEKVELSEGSIVPQERHFPCRAPVQTEPARAGGTNPRPSSR